MVRPRERPRPSHGGAYQYTARVTYRDTAGRQQVTDVEVTADDVITAGDNAEDIVDRRPDVDSVLDVTLGAARRVNSADGNPVKNNPALHEYLQEADALAEQVLESSSESRLAVRLATKVQALAEAARDKSPGARRQVHGSRRNPGAFDVSDEDVDLIVNALSFYRSKVGSSSLRERILDLIKLLWPALPRSEVGSTGWASFEEFAEASLDSQIDRGSKYWSRRTGTSRRSR